MKALHTIMNLVFTGMLLGAFYLTPDAQKWLSGLFIAGFFIIETRLLILFNNYIIFISKINI